MLSKLDKLYVVHVIKDSKKDKEKKDAWCAGGPLLPGLSVALAKFPHQVVEVEVGHCISLRRTQQQIAGAHLCLHAMTLEC